MDRSIGTAACIDTHVVETTVAALGAARNRMAELEQRLAALIAETDCAIASWNALLTSARTVPETRSIAAIAFPDQAIVAAPGGMTPPALPSLITDARSRLLAIAFDATLAAPLSGSVVDAVARPMPPCVLTTSPLPGPRGVIVDDLAQRVASAVESSEQLTLIRGLDADAAAQLNTLGIARFADIAALTSDDVTELGLMLGDRRRIAREGWIEQAALLAEGVLPLHARRARHLAILPCNWTTEHLTSGSPAPDVASSSEIGSDIGDAIVTAASIVASPAVAEDIVETGAAEAKPADTLAIVGPGDPKVIVLADVRRARPRPSHRTGVLQRAATVAAFSLMFAAAWTSIEIADGNWQAIASLVAGSPAAMVATTY